MLSRLFNNKTQFLRGKYAWNSKRGNKKHTKKTEVVLQYLERSKIISLIIKDIATKLLEFKE